MTHTYRHTHTQTHTHTHRIFPLSVQIQCIPFGTIGIQKGGAQLWNQIWPWIYWAWPWPLYNLDLCVTLSMTLTWWWPWPLRKKKKLPSKLYHHVFGAIGFIFVLNLHKWLENMVVVLFCKTFFKINPLHPSENDANIHSTRDKRGDFLKLLCFVSSLVWPQFLMYHLHIFCEAS